MGFMRKLNRRKVKWIIREIKKGELSVYRIGKQQDVTPQWVRELYNRYLETGEYPYPKPSGRRPNPLPDEDRTRVMAMKQIHPLSGATTLEFLLDKEDKHIPHNRIHRILKEEGLAKDEPKKQKTRKWVRYQRKHSNSLWHTDWSELQSGEHMMPLEDDASRFVTGFGVFPNATAENSAVSVESAINNYGRPRETLTDHGIQFTSIPREGCNEPEPNVFQKCLEQYEIKHIKARVKHPQSNGKVEKLLDTLRKLRPYYKNWEEVIMYYNFQRPHWSLNIKECETPFKAYIRKLRPDTRAIFVRENIQLVSKWATEYIEWINKNKK